MQRVLKISLFILLVSAITGCRKSKICTVTVYGPDYMTYTRQDHSFKEACRIVMHELSYAEKLDDNKTRYPYFHEAGSSHNEKDKIIAYKSFLETKDEEGYEYKIMEIGLGKKDPVVILETTNPDKYKLVNALYKEFSKRGFEVRNF